VHTLAGGDASDSLWPPLAGDAAMTLATKAMGWAFVTPVRDRTAVG
jgi:hypothetical protein